VAVGSTHAASEGEGRAHEIAANKNPTAIPMCGLRVMMVIACLHLLLRGETCLRMWLEHRVLDLAETSQSPTAPIAEVS
jgi:hypothetical protein